MNKAHKKSFNQHAFMSCIMASFLGALLFPFWLAIWGVMMGETVFTFELRAIFSYLMITGMAFFFGTIITLVVGWPTLLILHRHNINHPAIASLSGFLIMLIIWLTLYSGSLNFRALFAGSLLCMNGATFGFFASYFSRNGT